MLAIREGKIQKDKKKPQGEKGKDKGKNKLVYALKPKILPSPKRDNPVKDSVFHHCKEGLRGSRKLKHRDLSLYVFQNEVENQLGKKTKTIQSNQGGEYLSHEFVNHLKSCGIVSQLTPPYTPQHNGVSDRRNRTLLDMVQLMINLTTLLKSFWGYALESAARILNMVPTKNVERTPYEICYEKAPKLSSLRVWGCEALVKRDMPEKLDSRSIKCIFVGYLKKMMGCYFYYPLKNKIFFVRNAEFFENSIMQNPSEIHWTVVKALVKHFKNTKDWVFVYGVKPKAEWKVSCYVDASFQTDNDDTKSQTGYVFVLNGGVVDQKTTNQSTTAMYSTEAQYIAAAEASMEAV
nr:retrovirus-related Pol polyprotein from transposon TNT 1-94 [Tanacetum cinerariifolium]